MSGGAAAVIVFVGAGSAFTAAGKTFAAPFVRSFNADADSFSTAGMMSGAAAGGAFNFVFGSDSFFGAEILLIVIDEQFADGVAEAFELDGSHSDADL